MPPRRNPGICHARSVSIPISDAPDEIASNQDLLLEAENFGRDQDLRTLLKSIQPRVFIGEGDDVAKILEEWVVSMEDYFGYAGYNATAQGLMGRAKLNKPAKTWWKINCRSHNVTENFQGWEELKLRLKERYLPLNYDTTKMNEYLACLADVRDP